MKITRFDLSEARLESLDIAESTADPVLRAQFPRIYGQLQALRGDYAAAIPWWRPWSPPC